MGDRINILDEVLVSKIAAGEVVDRPASAVKELVENSLDAGASRIEVEIHGAGKALIRVTDNGCGMSEKDALLSVQRHATSKIRGLDDLFGVSTLGFRGEALAAVSSVSRFELITSDGTRGTKISVEGGKITGNKEAACPKGTSVVVKDLFFNTPARLKYLKSDATESGQISDIMSKLSVSRPDVAFRLLSDGREVFSSPGNGSLFDAVLSAYGSAFARSLIEVSHKSVKGFVSKPSDTRINRNYQHFFVNGRYVKNFTLSRALEAAYRNLIPGDRHPCAAVFIEMNPHEVDVNVHPAKKEVKFAHPLNVSRLVEEAVSDALSQVKPPQIIYSPDIESGISSSKPKEYFAAAQLQMPCPDNAPLRYEPPLETMLSTAGPFVAGVISDSYIVCIDGDDLVIIDQHAAHERMLFEKIRENAKSGTPDSQICLVPDVIELDKKEFFALEARLKELSSMGFDIEVFGKNSVRLKAVPSSLTRLDMKGMISDMASQMEDGPKGLKNEEAADRLAKLAACHGAVKAGDRLSPEEIKGLVKDLFSSPDFSTCPHGRPTVVRLEGQKLARLFGR